MSTDSRPRTLTYDEAMAIWMRGDRELDEHQRQGQGSFVPQHDQQQQTTNPRGHPPIPDTVTIYQQHDCVNDKHHRPGLDLDESDDVASSSPTPSMARLMNNMTQQLELQQLHQTRRIFEEIKQRQEVEVSITQEEDDVDVVSRDPNGGVSRTRQQQARPSSPHDNNTTSNNAMGRASVDSLYPSFYCSTSPIEASRAAQMREYERLNRAHLRRLAQQQQQQQQQAPRSNDDNDVMASREDVAQEDQDDFHSPIPPPPNSSNHDRRIHNRPHNTHKEGMQQQQLQCNLSDDSNMSKKSKSSSNESHSAYIATQYPTHWLTRAVFCDSCDMDVYTSPVAKRFYCIACCCISAVPEEEEKVQQEATNVMDRNNDGFVFG